MYAFRCCSCGHFVSAAHAGEQLVPYACPACGAGVKWTERGIKTFQPENWEVLADAQAERLQELDLRPHQVERHAPHSGAIAEQSQHHERSAIDTTSVSSEVV